MLAKDERLKERRSFNIAFKNKLVIRSRLLSLYFVYRKVPESKIGEFNLPKAAFIVGVSVNKNAVGRNLIKRRMREAYKELKRKVVIKDRKENKFYVIQSLILIANKEADKASFRDIKASVSELFEKLEVKGIGIKKITQAITRN